MRIDNLTSDLVKAHLIFQKMSRYPKHTQRIRELFISVIEERDLATEAELESIARKLVAQDGIAPQNPAVQEEYLNAVIDLAFASLVDLKEAEDWVNLAPKLAKNREMAKLLHWENASSREIFKILEEFCMIPQGDMVIPEAEAIGVRVALLNHFISNQLPYVGIAKKHITIRDIYYILQRSVWNPDRPGRIGGKAAGMILAHRILIPLLTEGDPKFQGKVDVADSYFIRSEIFDEFIQENDLEEYHSRKYETREKIEAEFPKIKAQFERANFSERTLEGFRLILERVGENPIILRSSSFLEDNFGLAFSGKYDSVFLANQGPLEERLERFIEGVKLVHMSTYHPDPILYRQDHNLLDFNEHMAVLVQRVVGRRFGDYFFPLCAGVIFSVNSFAWSPKIDRQSGLLRMVYGLGTRAVDRVGSGYPRMVPLSHPTLRPEADARSIRKYSQNRVDVVNLATGELETLKLTDLLAKVRHPDSDLAFSVGSGDHLAPPATKMTKYQPHEAVVTFDKLLKETDFPDLIRDLVQTVAEAYGRPVDMEFAYDNGKIYILQCRTLSVPKEAENVSLPTDVDPEKVIFTVKSCLPNRIINDIEYAIYVDPIAYDRLATVEEKGEVAKVVNRINRNLAEKRFALFGPGRWGSNDINLGVQVRYHDISRTRILAEVAFASEEGITPEVSFGTHFFNDLVEADIIPMPIYPDDESSVFNRDFFEKNPSVTHDLAPGFEHLADVVRSICVPRVANGDYLQVYLNASQSAGMAILGPKVNGN